MQLRVAWATEGGGWYRGAAVFPPSPLAASR